MAVSAAPFSMASGSIPVTAGGDEGALVAGSVDNSLSLTSFSRTLPQRGSAAPVGVYVDGVLALQIKPQPAGNPGFVTSQAQAVSLFGLAKQYGTTGLIAHNYLAGETFFNLKPGQEVVVIKANGSRARYLIESVRRVQALSPWSPHSNFVDLDQEGPVLTASQLFHQVYAGSDQVVFQTCIEAEGSPVWGRLFVTAKRIDVGPATNWAVKMPVLLSVMSASHNL